MARRIWPADLFFRWPLPISNFSFVYAFGVSLLDTLDNLSLKPVLQMCAGPLEGGHAVDHIDGQVEAIDLIHNREFQRSIDISFLFITADMKISVIRAFVSELMNQPRVTMKIEDDRLVRGEEGIEVAVGKTVGMF